MSDSPMIRFHKLTKKYGHKTTALNEVSFEIQRGEFVFVTGPSGAGKSTMLRLLLRQERPTDGTVLVGGRNVGAIPSTRIPELRRSIGVVFQDFKLIERKTALENVAYVLNLVGISRAQQRRRAYAALKSVGLNHRIHARPSILSGGEKQRCAIARALVTDPDLLLADEPTGNLDPDLAVDIMRLFREINARGTTVLVATHDRDLIQRMQRRTLILTGGELVDSARGGA